MADTMNHIERAVASLQDKPVDRLSTYPLAMGVCRRTVGDGTMTYREWATDPKKYAAGFIQGQKYFDFDWAIGLAEVFPDGSGGDLPSRQREDDRG